jgi:adenylosuccinate lyase
VALWHERDISHSSVERVILPDALQLCVYMLRKATGLVDGLVLHPERARENLEVNSLGLVYSQSVLLALVDSGLSRDEAYRIVQAAARTAIDTRTNFRAVIEADPAVTLSATRTAEAFDPQRLLVHRGRFLAALENFPRG